MSLSFLSVAFADREDIFHLSLCVRVSQFCLKLIIYTESVLCRWDTRGTTVVARGGSVDGEGNYARLTHVNLSSVCFLRARARDGMSL